MVKVRVNKQRGATVSGVQYGDVRSILTMAVLHAREQLDQNARGVKAKTVTTGEGKETECFYMHLLEVIAEVEQGLSAEHARVIVPR